MASARLRTKLAVLLALAGSLAACGAETADPTAPDGRWQALSQTGRYRISIRPEQAEPRIGSLHAWLVSVETEGGASVAPTQLGFDGGMPAHGHGFETRPRVTGVLGEGVYRVDGVRFHMPGAWQLRVDVAGPDGADFAVFDVEVGP